MNLRKKIRGFFTLTRKANGGFTLVELVVVIAILAILAGAAVPAYSGYINKAKEAADQQLLAALNTAYASACMENGKFDMTQLGFTPVATINADGSVAVNEFNDEFQNYFGSGAFKYYDKLGFVASEGVFKGNTVAQLIQIMKDSWNGSSFGSAADGGEAILETLLGTFDMIGGYFAGGFNMNAMLSGKPEGVQDAFNLGSFNLTDEEILEKYCPEYAALSDPEKAAWIVNPENENKINTIKGNAYVLHMANDAAGKDGATVLADVNKFVDAIQNPADEDAILAYYKSLPGVSQNATIEEARDKLELKTAGISAGTVVAMANSGMTNESGISTLGSMYALAAGYFNSGYYEQSSFYEEYGVAAKDLKLDYSDFSTFMSTVDEMDNFREYCANQGAADVDAYLSFMDSLSAGDVNMENSNAFSGLFEGIWGNIEN